MTGRLNKYQNICLQERCDLMYQVQLHWTQNRGHITTSNSSKKSLPNPLISLYDARVAHQTHTRSIKSAVETKPCQISCLPPLVTSQHLICSTKSISHTRISFETCSRPAPWRGYLVNPTYSQKPGPVDLGVSKAGRAIKPISPEQRTYSSMNVHRSCAV